MRIRRQARLSESEAGRTTMTILHFLLSAPRWSLSLMFFLASVQSPLPSFEDEVQTPLQKIHKRLRLESASYNHCVSTSAQVLRRNTQNYAEMELKRQIHLQGNTQEFLSRFEHRVGICRQSTNDALQLLKQWRTNGFEISWQNTCTHSQESLLLELMGETPQHNVDTTYDFNRSLEEQLYRYGILKNYSSSRVQYDYDYFVSSRIQPVIELANDISQMEPIPTHLDVQEVRKQVEGVLSGVQEVVEYAQNWMPLLEMQLERMGESVDALKEGYLTLFDHLARAAIFVQDLLPPGVPLPKYLRVDAFPVAESLLPPNIHFETPGFGDVFSSEILEDTTQACTELVENIVRGLASYASNHFHLTTRMLSQGILRTLSMDNYNPPRFPEGPHNASSTEIASLIVAPQKLQIQDLRKPSNASPMFKPSDTNTVNATILAEHENFGSDNNSIMNYLTPKLPDLGFPTVLSLIVVLFSSKLWLVELFLQFFRLWKLESDYSKYSTAKLQFIGNVHPCSAKPGPPPSNIKQLCTKWILTVVLLMVCLLSIKSLGSRAISFQCKERRSDAPLATSFFVPLIVNEANIIGNLNYMQTERRCQISWKETCGKLESQAFHQYQSDRSRLAVLHSELDQMLAIQEKARLCVHPNTTLQIETACCGLKGHGKCNETKTSSKCPLKRKLSPPASFEPLKNYLDISNCPIEERVHTLFDYRFDCQQSNPCAELPCDGADKRALHLETVAAACAIELYCRKLLLFILLALCHALGIGVICSLLLEGVQRLCWRKLFSKTVYFESLIDENGFLLHDKGADERAAIVRTTTHAFERMGKAQVLIGTLSVLAWIYVSAVTVVEKNF